jgi:C-terminal processing protease CtpA/Prc
MSGVMSGGRPGLRIARVGVQSALLGVLAAAATGCNGLIAWSAARKPAPAPSAPATRATTRTRAATAAAVQSRLPAEPPEPEPEPRASDSAGVARLAQLASVWHTVSLHHPWVATRGVPWDSALIIAVTRVRLASTDAALADAYRAMFSVLRDPRARVEIATTTSAPVEAVTATSIGDSILRIRIAPNARLDAADSTVVAQAIARAPSRVLMDLRGAPVHDALLHAGQLDAFLARAGVTQRLVRGVIAAPVVRTRLIGANGTAIDLSATSTFRDGWRAPAARVYEGLAPNAQRLVLLADSASIFPGVLLAIHDAGHASLVADGALRDAAPVPDIRIALTPQLEATVRIGELVHDDGTLDVIADTVVAPSSGPATATPSATGDRALDVALQLLRGVAPLPLAARPLPAFVPRATTPVFYDTTSYPFMGARLLGGFRLWSAMRARHAHRDLYDDDLDAVFARVIPKIEEARDGTMYARAISDLAASLDDSEALLRGLTADSVVGSASLPFRLRSAEGRVFISDVVRDSSLSSLALAPGAEILSFDGFTMTSWFSEHRRMVSASNEWTRVRDLLHDMAGGPAGDAIIKVKDLNNRERTITVPRRVAYRAQLPVVERPAGAPIRMLTDAIAYIDAERLTDETVDAAFSAVTSARGVLLDLRGTLHADDARIVRRLATRSRAVVGRVVQRALTAPCLVSIREAVTACPDLRESQAWQRDVDTAAVLPGRLVVLIDERTQGAMERLALSLEQMASVTFIGGSSAGAISPTAVLSLPGGLSIGIATLEIRRSDGSQLQRVGITPTIDVRPTAKGLRAVSDEVLERAQQWLQQQLDATTRRKR